MIKAFISKKLPIKQTILLSLDFILSVAMLVVIITGIFISDQLFRFNVPSRYTVFTIHNITSYICLAILTVHLVMHAKYIANAIIKAVLHLHDYDTKKTFASFIASCLTVCVVYVAIFI